MLHILILAVSFVFAADLPSFEKCYKQYGQVEQTKEDGKKITVYKDEFQVAMECNDKIFKFSDSVKDKATFDKLSKIVGVNSNWANTTPIYANAIKTFKKEYCVTPDLYKHVLSVALARPEDDNIYFNSTKKILEGCWPANKDSLVKMMTEDVNGYTKDHLCNFLKSKKALPENKRKMCEA